MINIVNSKKNINEYKTCLICWENISTQKMEQMY